MKKLAASVAKRVATAFAYVLSIGAVAAVAASISLITGAQDPSQFNATINSLINSINSIYGYGYLKVAPLTGGSYTMPAFKDSYLAIRPAGTISTLSAVLPAVTIDGSRACLFSTQIITTLTLTAPAGQTVNDAITTLGANGSACYIYGSSNTTWDRDE